MNKPMSFIVVFRSLALCLALLSLFGCATPQTVRPAASDAAVEAEAFKQKCLVIQEDLAFRERLFNVSFRVSDGAKQMTMNRQYFCGFLVVKRSHFPSEYQSAAAEVFRLGTGAKVILVAAGSPADQAGLKPGDEVISINGEAVPEDRKNMADFIKKLNTEKPVRFHVVRDGEKIATEFVPVSCAECNIVLLNDEKVNAYADGQRIYITKGMMRFAANDDELAMVVSHEMAHNLREHLKMSRKNSAVGGVFGLLLDVAAGVSGLNTGGGFMKKGMQAGQGSYTKEMEAEADYVGLYILAFSGYDIHTGPNIFRRLGASNPRNIEAKYATSHPSSPERFVMLELTIKEIDGKRETGGLLLPEEKSKSQKGPGNPN